MIIHLAQIKKNEPLFINSDFAYEVNKLLPTSSVNEAKEVKVDAIIKNMGGNIYELHLDIKAKLIVSCSLSLKCFPMEIHSDDTFYLSDEFLDDGETIYCEDGKLELDGSFLLPFIEGEVGYAPIDPNIDKKMLEKYKILSEDEFADIKKKNSRLSVLDEFSFDDEENS